MTAQNDGTKVMAQGRIVWVSGNLFKGRPKLDFNTKAPKIDRQGNPMTEYGFGLAIPKSILGDAAPGRPGYIWTVLHEEAYKLFPSRQIPPAFAMKFKDGDGIDDKGIPFSQRAGYKDHIVLACTTSLQPKFYRYENGDNIPITEGIKCGDYVDVQLVVKAHPAIGQGKAGLYVNPYAVRFLGYGEEIVNVPSGNDVFGTAAPVIPQGASVTPMAPQGFIAPQAAAPQPMGQYQAPGTPQVTAQQYQPNHGVLPQNFQQQAPQQGYGQPQGNVPGFQSAPVAAPFTQQQPPAFATPAMAPAGNPQGFPIPGQGQ